MFQRKDVDKNEGYILCSIQVFFGSLAVFKVIEQSLTTVLMLDQWPVQTLQQCCPTYLYIGAHLTDGCGGAGAVWRFQ
jgi:hypothetical protein